MTSYSSDAPDEVRRHFESSVNKHGHGFHHGLIKYLSDPRRREQSGWCNPIPEFPVSVNGTHTHIDIVLQHRGQRLYMLGECKRVNPALRAWCFSTWWEDLRLSERQREYYVEVVSLSGAPSTNLKVVHSQVAYHAGFEVKTNQKGESGDPGRTAIADACTQVLRGLNGFAEFLVDKVKDQSHRKSVALIPVIFTTATLYVSSRSLADADLSSGNLITKPGDLREVPWLVLHYAQSAGLRHSLPVLSENRAEASELAGILYREYIRPIAIVSVSGIDDFMGWQAWEDFDYNMQSGLS